MFKVELKKIPPKLKSYFKKKAVCHETSLEISDISPIERELSSIEIPHCSNLKSLLGLLRDYTPFKRTCTVLEEYSAEALVPSASRALLFFLTRHFKPHYALEIGTYRAGSTEIIARALRMNGRGTLLTIDPFGKERVPAILNTWPKNVSQHVEFMPLSSMDCFIELSRRSIECELIFVDGDHSYEYALYDLQMAARHIKPGGIVIMDNAEQTGVYWAVKDFLKSHTDWRELGDSIAHHDPSHPFETMHPSFPDSSFLLLQAPTYILVSSIPRSFYTRYAEEKGLAGFHLHLSGEQDEGVLHALVFFRSFYHGGYDGIPEQMFHHMHIPIHAGEKEKHVSFQNPYVTQMIAEHSYRTYEIILSWQPKESDQGLVLVQSPEPIKLS